MHGVGDSAVRNRHIGVRTFLRRVRQPVESKFLVTGDRHDQRAHDFYVDERQQRIGDRYARSVVGCPIFLFWAGAAGDVGRGQELHRLRDISTGCRAAIQRLPFVQRQLRICFLRGSFWNRRGARGARGNCAVDHFESREPDFDRGSRGDVLRLRHRHGSDDLPMDDERRGDLRRQRGFVHHRGDNDGEQRRSV
jgi:hypothetical protein